MPFSIELFFDTQSSLKTQQCGDWLEKTRVPATFSTRGSKPPVRLAVFEQTSPDRLRALLKKRASGFAPFSFRLSSIGTFPGREGVLFPARVVTGRLQGMHGRLHRALSVQLTPRKLPQRLERLRRKGFSIQGRYTHLALVETQPVRIKPIRFIDSVSFSGKELKK